MKAENRGQRVRGVVAIGNRSTGCLCLDEEGAKEHGTLLAYTHWYRHDDNLEQLERDLRSLVDCYSQMKQTGAISYTYEYKDYVR